jgi:hypothetical protein
MNQNDLIAAQDDQRTKRSFISLLSGFLNVNDASYAGQDSNAQNFPNGYQIIGSNGAIGVEGLASSNMQNTRLQLSGNTLLLLAVGAYFLIKK